MKDDNAQNKANEAKLLFQDDKSAHACFSYQFLIIVLLSIIAIDSICPSSSQSVPSQAVQGLSTSSVPATPPSYMQGSPSIPAEFQGDWYWVDGGPNLQITLTPSSIYRNQETTLYLYVTNNGRVTTFKVLTQPEPTRPDEVYAAQLELQLEAQRSTAQDVSVRLVAVNDSAIDLKRDVAYAGSLKEGQVSQPLPYPIEVYENTEPGNYLLYAIANYTYQQDVAVKPHSDSPQNPDIYYWYSSVTQTFPLILQVEKMSLVDLKALNITPGNLNIGSKNNVVKVFIQNQGSDTAKDIVARLRP